MFPGTGSTGGISCSLAEDKNNNNNNNTEKHVRKRMSSAGLFLITSCSS
jgi:hypothetical protein